MAKGGSDVVDLSFLAKRDLSGYQYAAMRMNGNDTVDVGTSALFYHVGVLQNKPAAAGRGATVRVAGRTKIKLGGTVTAGQSVSAAASGWIKATTSGQQGLGICLVGGNSGYVGEALLTPMAHYSVTSAENNQG